MAVILLAVGFSERTFIILKNFPSVPKLLKVYNQDAEFCELSFLYLL